MLALCMAPLPALADSAHPANPEAPAAALRYQSVFAAYRGIDDGDAPAPDAGWRAANDTVGRLGGHAGHVRATPSSAGQDTAPAAGGQSVDHAHGARPRAQGQ